MLPMLVSVVTLTSKNAIILPKFRLLPKSVRVLGSRREARLLGSVVGIERVATNVSFGSAADLSAQALRRTWLNINKCHVRGGPPKYLTLLLADPKLVM